ncbi:GTPase Obg [Methylacidimicrobium cyclopophantes]|uniref:GTPase Obg n=1 Tax=Methylacidimicrobium cyclopophantes TaxID=1041766 RepID=A0A5E6MIA0_9BACT|nr:GTPase ObgE [Methylacidimicrobium cyclopophantes]VVM07639.1 GTPase Obg [Methylacidimicrobium cyclopophantes]
MFVDRVRIFAKAGDGGRGCVSFRRAPYEPHGGPDGGDGGKGGDVVLVVDPHRNDLSNLFFAPHQAAQDGRPGMGATKSGRKGADLLLPVPPGTIVSRIGGSLEQGSKLLPLPPRDAPLDLLVDLTPPMDRFVLCHGGRGGWGNWHFRGPQNQAPRRADPGKPGECGQFVLELKLLADIGLVGLPNAGKSSLLRRLTSAEPKVADYPFTTLTPSVGVLESPEGDRLTVADIPGLIRDAHLGKGLGDEFLRHVERCPLLLLVLDLSGVDPLADFFLLRRELEAYGHGLAGRPFLVVGNKIDLRTAKKAALRRARPGGEEPVFVSARTGQGVLELAALAWEKLCRSRPEAARREAGLFPAQGAR